MVYELILSYVTPRLTSQNWEERYVAVNCLFLITEGCKKLIRRDLRELAERVRPLLQDPCKIVKQKASFFFTEVEENIGAALIEVAPWLIQDINQLLLSNDPSSIENSLVILETIGLQYGRTHKEEMIMLVVGIGCAYKK